MNDHPKGKRAVVTVADVNPRQAWMALPRRTRLEAVDRAKQGRAHSAAGVRLAAMAWGRYAPRLIVMRVSIGLVVAFAVFLVPLANDWPFPVAVLGLLPMVAVMVGEAYAQRRWEGWHRMLGPVNGRRVLLDQAGTAQPLEVGRSFAARYAVPGYLLLAVVGPAAIELTGGHFGAAVLLAAAAAGLAWRAYRRYRRLAQPPLRIDGSGVTFHRLGWTIPWSAIASCDLTDEGDRTVSRQYGEKSTGGRVEATPKAPRSDPGDDPRAGAQDRDRLAGEQRLRRRPRQRATGEAAGTRGGRVAAVPGTLRWRRRTHRPVTQPPVTNGDTCTRLAAGFGVGTGTGRW
nr:hypothetical protein GCM10020092_106760 [Actinoplanes digitatis]